MVSSQSVAKVSAATAWAGTTHSKSSSYRGSGLASCRVSRLPSASSEDGSTRAWASRNREDRVMGRSSRITSSWLKTRSSAVTGVPSSHTASCRMAYFTVAVPAAATVTPPLAMVGSSSTSHGCMSPPASIRNAPGTTSREMAGAGCPSSSGFMVGATSSPSTSVPKTKSALRPTATVPPWIGSVGSVVEGASVVAGAAVVAADVVGGGEVAVVVEVGAVGSPRSMSARPSPEQPPAITTTTRTVRRSLSRDQLDIAASMVGPSYAQPRGEGNARPRRIPLM